MSESGIGGWWHAYQRRRADSPWQGRSPRRFRAVIRPAITTAVGVLLMVLLPTVQTLGLVIFLGGLSATIIALFLAAISD